MAPTVTGSDSGKSGLNPDAFNLSSRSFQTHLQMRRIHPDLDRLPAGKVFTHVYLWAYRQPLADRARELHDCPIPQQQPLVAGIVSAGLRETRQVHRPELSP